MTENIGTKDRIVQWFSAFELLSFVTPSVISDYASGLPNIYEDILSDIEQLCCPPTTANKSRSEDDSESDEDEEIMFGYFSPKSIAYVVRLLDLYLEQHKSKNNQSVVSNSDDEEEEETSNDSGSGDEDAINWLVKSKVPISSFCTLIGVILSMPCTSDMYDHNINPLLQIWLSRLYIRLLRMCGLRSRDQSDPNNSLFNGFTIRSIITLCKMCLTEKLQFVDTDWAIVPVDSSSNDTRKRKKTQRNNKSKKRKVSEVQSGSVNSCDSVPEDIQSRVVKLVPLLLDDICELLTHYSFEEMEDDIFEYLIEKITDCTRSQIISANHRSTQKTEKESIEVYRQLFAILKACVSSLHGDESDNLSCVLCHLIANFSVKFSGVKQTTTEFIIGLSTSGIEKYADHVIAFIQHTLVRIAEAKSDKRGSGISFLCDMSEVLFSEQTNINRIVGFLADMCKSKKTQNRLIAIEYSMRMLIKLIQLTSQDQVEENENISSLLLSITSRTTDKIASIRAKALNCYVSLLDRSDEDKTFKAKLRLLLSPDEPVDQDLHNASEQQFDNNSFDQMTPIAQTPKSVSIAEDISQAALCASCGFIGSRTVDPSALVRKAAIQVIEGMINLNPKHFLKSEFIDVIKKHALDVSVANRKQSIISITQLMNTFPDNIYIYKTAITILLVCSFDGETSVSEKALELVNSHIFTQLTTKKSATNRIWDLLEDITEEHYRLLCKSCSVLISKKEISSSIVKHIITKLKDQSLRSGWYLLDILSTHFSKHIPTEFLITVFEEKNQSSDLTLDDTFVFDKCLTILSRVYDNLTDDTRQQLSDSILKNLVEFRINTNLVHSHVVSLYKLCDTRSQIDAMYSRLVNKSYNELHKYVLSYSENVDAEQISKYLFTIGEVSMIYSRASNKIVTLVQALIAASVTTIADESTLDLKPTPTKHVRVSSLVRAHAFAALGKMCLIDEGLAKKSVPLFIREIEKSNDEAVRNNVVVVMCDLCVKYTSVVDRYIAKISESMCDKSPLVRRNALSLLTQVIAEDFVKWKPLILFRFLYMLTDTCDIVAKYAEYALCVVLPRKNSTLLFSHTIEAIFVLNRYSSHPSHNNYLQSDRELSLFNCGGSSSDQIAKRFQIYKFLLHQFSSEQLLELHVKLHTDVLGMFADESIPVHADVLTDVLNMLSWPQFKLRSLTTSAPNHQNDMEEEDPEEISTKVGTIQGKLLGSFLKKHVSDNVIPIIVELKRTLEKKRSPLLRQVMLYLQLIMSEYKNECSDFLFQDKQTAKEIEFDLKRISAQNEVQITNRRGSSTTKVPFCTPVRSPYPISASTITPSRRKSRPT